MKSEEFVIHRPDGRKEVAEDKAEEYCFLRKHEFLTGRSKKELQLYCEFHRKLKRVYHIRTLLLTTHPNWAVYTTV